MMRREMDFSSMTERELRAYRRLLRRRRELRLKLTKLFLMFVLVLVAVFGVQSISAIAHAAGNEEPSYKYYTQITVESGDTLWSIAKEHMDEEHYSGVNAYIKEVCTINGCKADSIKSGQNLIIPYYSAEYVY